MKELGENANRQKGLNRTSGVFSGEKFVAGTKEELKQNSQPNRETDRQLCDKKKKRGG